MVTLGVVLTTPAPSAIPGGAAAARMVQVQLVPDGRIVEARVAVLGQGSGRGVFCGPGKGDEVLVLMPAGDPNRAVVLGGLGSAAIPNPAANTGAHLLALHPGGVELRDVDGPPANGLVHGQFLAELGPYLAALEAFMFAVSTATIASQIAAAAVVFMSAVLQAGVGPSVFTGNVTASGATVAPDGPGTAPYATAKHKATP